MCEFCSINTGGEHELNCPLYREWAIRTFFHIESNRKPTNNRFMIGWPITQAIGIGKYDDY